MWKRRSILFSALLVAVVTGLAFVVVRKPPAAPPEPVYNGKPISFWIDRPSINLLTSGSGVRPYVQFPKTVDTNALPYLTSALRRRNGPFLKVSQVAWNASPVFLKNRWAKPLDVAPIRAAAALVIGNLGSRAQPAIQELIRTLNEDEDTDVRICAAYALGQIGAGNKAVTDCLTTASQETNTMVGGTACNALSRIQAVGRWNP